MAIEQQPVERIAASSFGAMLSNFSQLGRRAQAIAGEFAKMSEENLGAGAKAAERMRGAKSLQDVAGIQADLMRETYECSANHYRKIAEIAVSAPAEMARNTQELVSSMAEAGQEAATRAQEIGRNIGDQAAKMAAKTADTAQSAAEDITRRRGG